MFSIYLPMLGNQYVTNMVALTTIGSIYIYHNQMQQATSIANQNSDV